MGAAGIERRPGTPSLLRELNDRKGQSLVDGVIEVVDRLKPLHLSIVGGEPLVRYRELEELIPLLIARGIHVQIVTSAFRVIPAHWRQFKRLNVVVSIDGLQPEHDLRRAPATYERILKNIADASAEENARCRRGSHASSGARAVWRSSRSWKGDRPTEPGCGPATWS